MTDHERQIFYDLLWEHKKTIPRGTPFSQVIVEAENILFGWAWPSWVTERPAEFTVNPSS